MFLLKGYGALFIICLRVKQTECKREAPRSWNDLHACNVLLRRAYFPHPTQRRRKKEKKWEAVFEMVLGAPLQSPLQKNEHHSVGCPNLLLVYESFMLTTIIHTSHFISQQSDAKGSQHISLQCTCLLGVCLQVGEHLRHLFSVYYVCVCLYVCMLRGYYPLAVEAECLNVARVSRLYCSPYLLITSDSLMFPLPIFLAKLS